MVELVAGALGTGTQAVRLVRGKQSRVKILRVAGLSVRDVIARLAAAG